MLCLRKNAWRIHHRAKPWQCFGSLLQAQSELGVLLLNMQAMDPGIAYKHLFKHLETPTGKEFCKNETSFYKVGAGECMWIPFGYMAMPFGIAAAKNGFDHAYLIPVFSPDGLKGLKPGPRQKIIEYNRVYLEKGKEEPHFAKSLSLLEKFIQEL